MKPKTCHRCGEPLERDVKFCGSCGAATLEHQHIVRARGKQRMRDEGRHVAAVLAVFALTLGALAAVPSLLPDLSEDLSTWVAIAAQVGVGLVACAILGRGALADSLASAPAAKHLAWGVGVGALAFAVAWGWVDGLVHPGPATAPDPFEGATPLLLVAIVVGVPLVEEWLDRGVLWRALEPLTNEVGVILVTATLFALAHGLNGGWVLEFPHRFVGGLLLGWLRARSGSLVPGIVAHVTWNALAVWGP